MPPLRVLLCVSSCLLSVSSSACPPVRVLLCVSSCPYPHVLLGDTSFLTLYFPNTSSLSLAHPHILHQYTICTLPLPSRYSPLSLLPTLTQPYLPSLSLSLTHIHTHTHSRPQREAHRPAELPAPHDRDQILRARCPDRGGAYRRCALYGLCGMYRHWLCGVECHSLQLS